MYGFIVIPQRDLTPYDYQTLGMFLVGRLAVSEFLGTRISEPTNVEGLLRGERPKSPASSFYTSIADAELAELGFTKRTWRKYRLRQLGPLAKLRAVGVCADESELEEPVYWFFYDYPRQLIRRIFAFQLPDDSSVFDPPQSPALTN